MIAVTADPAYCIVHLCICNFLNVGLCSQDTALGLFMWSFNDNSQQIDTIILGFLWV